MKKLLLLTVCVIMVLSCASFAQMMGDDDMGNMVDHSGKYMGMKDKLGLTQEQAAKMKEIKDNLGQKNKPLIEQRNTLSKELKALLKQDDPDLAAVEAKIKELQNVRTQIMLNKISAAKASNKVLTKEQKDKIRHKAEAKKSKMKERMQQKKGK